MSLLQRLSWRAILAGLALTTLLTPLAWALNDEAQAAKDEGMRLWGIHQWEKMQPPLEIAAASGDVEAMYYLGEANRLLSRGLSQAALDWYYQAAQHGEPYAMLRLFDGGACELGDVCPENGDDWPQAALELTLPKAEAGDPEAMSVLYDIYFYVEEPDEEKAMEWLLRAAEAGHVESMNLLGKIARNDEDSYANDTERLEAAEPWFRQAAEVGYAPAMHNLSSVLNHLGQPEESWEWVNKASDAGHIYGRTWLAACNIAPDWEELTLCNSATAPEPAKGWAIFLAIHEEVPGTSSERSLRVYRESVTPEQREEGERMMDEWLNLEPPLSYFPEKFGP
ncbi:MULTISPECIES: tetratricopeptide repeat protein [Halomonadaceae]|uniref:tetratricopeptide repeat protein n=1 Tax=Halomonadaceae TaxID=28256 RepID=UPI001C6356EE|nr:MULTISPECIES: tetratricopeptide repeat protein [Halomonas]MCG7591825.1 sel1 repeat family protein [Halomonas sp. McD50-5]MCG7617828.1 sel1 repeat family protein [Halomonas sp. McD50-4]